MGLLVFLIVALAGTAATLITTRWVAVRAAVAVLALGACVATAYSLDPGTTLHFGDGALSVTRFLRLWLLTASAAALLLELVTLLLAGRDRFAPAALVTLAGSAVALAVPDAAAALLLLSGVAAVVGLAAAGRLAEGSPTLRAGVDALRVTVAVAVLGLLGIAWAVEPGVALEPTTMVAAYLLVAAALALRMGAVPLHLPAARLAEVAPRPLVPILSGWLPAALAVVLLGWFATAVVALTPDLGWWRQVPVALGLLTLAATSLAILFQEDLGHVLGYAAIQGGAFALLAMGSLQAATATEIRSWLLILPLTVAALTAVVLILEGAFGSRRVVELHGWLRRAPATGIALLLAVLATYGVPGMIQFVARERILEASAGQLLATLGLVAAALAVLAWLRLAWVGLRRPGDAVVQGIGERPRLASSRAPSRSRAMDLAARALPTIALNRIGLAAVLAIMLAALPVALGWGAGHLPDAAAEPQPQPSATASPTASPQPTGSPEATPGASEEPGTSAEPGAPTEPGSSSEPSPSPSLSPSAQPTPSPSAQPTPSATASPPSA